MATSKGKAQLLRVGPFKGLDSTTAGPYVEQGRGALARNVDVRRIPGALTTARGRVNLATLGGSGEVSSLAELVTSLDTRYIIAALSSNAVRSYRPDAPTAEALVFNGQPFTQAIQYGPTLFTSSGQQIGLGPNGIQAMKWQYTVADTGFAPALATNPATGANMAQYTYTYLFTVAIQLPTQTYAVDEYGQESSPIGYSLSAGGAVVYAYQATISDANHNVLVSANNGNTWGGTLADGSKWGVNIYRMSSNAQIPYLAYSYFWQPSDKWKQLVNGSTVVDSSPDSAFASNKQLLFNQDPPPVSVQAPGAIFAHKERLWAFVIQQNADTFNQPQCQLWFSGYGLPWQFNKAVGVRLVGNDGTPNDTGSALYGDLPVAGVSLASVGVLHKLRTLWILYGDDENSFVARKVGNYGCVSLESIAVCQGIEYWLTEEGVFAFDGANAPQYISERIKDDLSDIPILDQQNAVGWFDDRTYYLSIPHITGTEPITYPASTFGTNAGSPTITISGSGQRQDTIQTAETATDDVSCHGTLVKPDPRDPDTWFERWTCTAGAGTPADWSVTTAVAPVNAGTQLVFTANAITGNAPAILTLKNPASAVVLTTALSQGFPVTYSDPAAATGTYTWEVSVDTSGLIGSDLDNNPSGSYSVTVTPTTTMSIPAGGAGATTDGVSTYLQTRTSVAPVDAGTQLSLIISNIVVPSDANGTTSYTVQLQEDSLGAVLRTWTGITTNQTLTYSNAGAPSDFYVWRVWATVTSNSVASETFSCSCSLTAQWTEAATERSYEGGVTFAYYLPTQEWFTYPYATNAIVAQASENNPLPASQRLNAAIAARPGTLMLDAWNGADTDLGGVVSATWESPYTDSGEPAKSKTYQLCYLNAPVQPATATFTLSIDRGAITPPTKTFSWTIDLSKGPSFVWTVAVDETRDATGFLAQLSVTASSYSGNPGVIYSAGVYGDVMTDLVDVDNGAVT